MSKPKRKRKVVEVIDPFTVKDTHQSRKPRKAPDALPWVATTITLPHELDKAIRAETHPGETRTGVIRALLREALEARRKRETLLKGEGYWTFGDEGP